MESIHHADGNDRAEIRLTLTRLDLNLVLALDALLTERNVTRAAERLGLSQPALSAALSRLRAHFDDPLLVRTGRTHELSALATRLAALTGGTLDRLHAIFRSTADFEPASEVREFVIHASDNSATTVGVRVRNLASRAAPGVSIRFIHQAAAALQAPAPAELLAASDGVILPHGVFAGGDHIDVMRDEWVCIVADTNTVVGAELRIEDLATLPWVSNHHGPDRAIPPARHLHLLGIRPNVDTVVDGFLSLPYFVSGTDRIAFMPAAAARLIPRSLGVRVLDAPFPAIAHELAFWWHPVHDGDPAHEWLRSLFAAVGAENLDSPAPLHPR